MLHQSLIMVADQEKEEEFNFLKGELSVTEKLDGTN